MCWVLLAYGIRCGNKRKFAIGINTFVPAFGIIRHVLRSSGVLSLRHCEHQQDMDIPKGTTELLCISSLKARKGISLMKRISVLSSSRLSRVAKTSKPKFSCRPLLGVKQAAICGLRKEIKQPKVNLLPPKDRFPSFKS